MKNVISEDTIENIKTLNFNTFPTVKNINYLIL